MCDTINRSWGYNKNDTSYKTTKEIVQLLVRAAGYDATRVVNHPDRAVGDGWRYGSDAVVLEGRVFDVYGNFGSPGGSNVQALDVGPYEAGRLRE